MSLVSFRIESFILLRSIRFCSVKGITDFDIPRNSPIGSKIVKEGSGMMKCPLSSETYLIINSSKKDEPAETKIFSCFSWFFSANLLLRVSANLKSYIEDRFRLRCIASRAFGETPNGFSLKQSRIVFSSSFNSEKLGVFLARNSSGEIVSAALPRKAVFSQSLLLIDILFRFSIKIMIFLYRLKNKFYLLKQVFHRL